MCHKKLTKDFPHHFTYLDMPKCKMKILNILSDFVLHLLAPFFSVLKIWKIPQNLNMKTNSIREKRNCYLNEGDIKSVMERLGISYKLTEEDGLGAGEFAEMFEEEPSLEEVKEAFDVFDENKDGFIDVTELQRVLRCLGAKENSVQVEECTRMIKVADEDGDGRIDFSEFVKFMETSL